VTGTLFDVLAIVAVLVLTACAAIFVAAEYALTTLERVQVERHVREIGDRRAHQVARASARCPSSSPAPNWASRCAR